MSILWAWTPALLVSILALGCSAAEPSTSPERVITTAVGQEAPIPAHEPDRRCLRVPEDTANFISFRSFQLVHLDKSAVRSRRIEGMYLVAMTFKIVGFQGTQRGVWAVDSLRIRPEPVVVPANAAAQEHFVHPVGGGLWAKPPADWPTDVSDVDGVEDALACL